MEVFSTISSPAFSELALIIEGHTVTYLPQDVTLFETLGEMNQAKPFKLVFLPQASKLYQEEVRQGLVEALDIVVAGGLLKFLDSPPTIR